VRSHSWPGAIGFPNWSAYVAARSGREPGVKDLKHGRWTAQVAGEEGVGWVDAAVIR